MKAVKFLSVVAVAGCSILFSNNESKAFPGFGPCGSITCARSGIGQCLDKYNGDYDSMAAANPSCTAAFKGRCMKNCDFDADNCWNAVSKCPQPESDNGGDNNGN